MIETGDGAVDSLARGIVSGLRPKDRRVRGLRRKSLRRTRAVARIAGWRAAPKRAMDIAVSAVFLSLLWPLLLALAVAVTL